IDDKDYSEAEFLCGYIALRFRKEPGLAFDHFAHILARVTSPYAKARAAYWGGRAAEAAAKPDLAAKWYTAGAEHNATFYGQLAADGARLSGHQAAGRRHRRAAAAAGDHPAGERLCAGSDQPGRRPRPDAADAGDGQARRQQIAAAVLAGPADHRRRLQRHAR